MVPDHTGGAHSTTSGRMVRHVPVSGRMCVTMWVAVDRLQMLWNTCTCSYNLLERLNVSRPCATSPLSRRALSTRL